MKDLYCLKQASMVFLLASLFGIILMNCNPKSDHEKDSLGLIEVNTSTLFDLAILYGRVMDPETNYDKVSNVGVKDGKIVIITEDAIKGKETIDAKGHVVAPGFIDTHWHSLDAGVSGNRRLVRWVVEQAEHE